MDIDNNRLLAPLAFPEQLEIEDSHPAVYIPKGNELSIFILNSHIKEAKDLLRQRLRYSLFLYTKMRDKNQWEVLFKRLIKIIDEKNSSVVLKVYTLFPFLNELESQDRMQLALRLQNALAQMDLDEDKIKVLQLFSKINNSISIVRYPNWFDW